MRAATTEGKRARIAVRTEPHHVTAQLAVPIGLLVTEAVTNALKYAFVGREGGSVEIELAALGDDRVALTVRDDGVGLMPGRRTSGLGITLMEGFARQLEGSLHLESKNGTTVRVVFPRRALVSAGGLAPPDALRKSGLSAEIYELRS
jgi:two-component sensor histidine kinase